MKTSGGVGELAERIAAVGSFSGVLCKRANRRRFGSPVLLVRMALAQCSCNPLDDIDVQCHALIEDDIQLLELASEAHQLFIEQAPLDRE